MNINIKAIVPVVIGVTAGAVVGFVSKRKRKRSAEIEEYYDITVMRMLETDGENVYHSPKFSKPISSTEIIRAI